MAILNHSHWKLIFDRVACESIDIVILNDECLDFFVVHISSPNDQKFSIPIANPPFSSIQFILSGIDLFSIGLEVGCI